MRSTVPPGVCPERSRRARWALPLLLLAILGLVIPGLVAPATAYAADDPGIKVEVTKLVATDKEGNGESDTQLIQWQPVKIGGTWDASSLPAIAAGTSFTLGFPEVFTFREPPRTDPMTVRDEGGVERTVGECTTTNAAMTCTFNEEAANLSRAGFKNFKGGFSLLLTVAAATSQGTVKFNLNGQQRDVDLPGPAGIAAELYGPAQLTKWTQNPVSIGQTTNTWAVFFGTDYMRDNVKPAGTIKTDGSVSTLVFHEVLAPGQEFDWSRPGEAYVGFHRSAANNELFDTLWSMNGAVKHPDWNVEIINNAANDITIKITGPFPAATNMIAYLPVKFAEPAKPGVKYSNTVSAEGLESSSTVSAYYVDTVEITVTMEPGYGTFKVNKLVEGSGAALLDKDVQFPVRVDFTLPAHYNTYNPVWQPPAGFTIDPDGLSGHGSIMIAPGKTTYFDPQVTLPTGTKVTLSEDPSAAQPAAPRTIQWGEPAISNNSFVIGDQQVTNVQITNSATYVARPAVSVGDYVWEDVNKDGLQDDADKPIEGVTLTISRSDGGTVNNADGSARAELTTKTDAAGKYVFDNLQVLPANTHYVVTATAPEGFEATKDGAGERDKDSSARAGKAESVDLTTDGASDMTLDFGFARPAVSVGDYVWEDVNKDGLQDDADKPIEGVTLTISRSDGGTVNNADGSARAELTTKTDAAGKYVFDNLQVLPANTHYVVTATAPEGFEATKDGAGERDKDSSARAGKAESVDLTTDGASDMTLDFGFARPEPPATPAPTVAPSTEPDEPSATPTATPSAEPSATPSTEPNEPSAAPTDQPTATPTDEPTATPTDEPTATPTDQPTATPTDQPTDQPTATDEPTAEPAEPTATSSTDLNEPLASTGASILVPLLIAGAALGGGSVLVARRRYNG